MTIMRCNGCERFVSEWSDYVVDDDGATWHTPCWLKVDWHVGHDDPKRNPRPMTDGEKLERISQMRADVTNRGAGGNA